MTGFNHGLTGAVIAITVKRPELAVPLAFLSHFVQDAVPHHDYFNEGGTKILRGRFNYLLIGDFVFSLTLMAFLGGAFPDRMWTIWACMIAAASPDLMWAYYYLYLRDIRHRKFAFGPLARFHKRMEWLEFSKGGYIEAAWVLVFGALILILR